MIMGTQHPIEYERSRRAVALAIGDGHRTRGAIVQVVRRHLPVGTVSLVVCALNWLKGQGHIEYVRGSGWQPRAMVRGGEA